MKVLKFVFLYLFIVVNIANSANKITVATIGSLPPTNLFERDSSEKTINNIINFWEKELAQVLPYSPDLIVLPEMCDRPLGLTLEERDIYYTNRGTRIEDYFTSVAKKNNCYIAFNTRNYTDKSVYNTTYIIGRKGELVGVYNKNFPTIGEMKNGIKPAVTVPVFECDFGRVTCAVCFDLNFDELRKRHAELKPDIILFSSMYHGGLVQNYWAYSAESFFVSSCGPVKLTSEILNPLGEIISTSTNYFNYAVKEINLDYEVVHLDNNWTKLRALKEKYKNRVSIHDPGKLGVVLVTSEDNRVSAQEMLKEFDIMNVSSYFNESRNYRNGCLIK